MEIPMQYQAGAIWKLPSGTIVQTVLGKDGMLLNGDGLAFIELGGAWQYDTAALMKRLEGATYLGSRDYHGFAWSTYVKTAIECERELASQPCPVDLP